MESQPQNPEFRNNPKNYVVVFLINVPPTAQVIWRRGHSLVSSDRLMKPGIEPATPDLQGKWPIHYTIAAPIILKTFTHELSP